MIESKSTPWARVGDRLGMKPRGHQPATMLFRFTPAAGVNNAFLVNCKDPLAVTYNDSSGVWGAFQWWRLGFAK